VLRLLEAAVETLVQPPARHVQLGGAPHEAVEGRGRVGLRQRGLRHLGQGADALEGDRGDQVVLQWKASEDSGVPDARAASDLVHARLWPALRQHGGRRL